MVTFTFLNETYKSVDGVITGGRFVELLQSLLDAEIANAIYIPIDTDDFQALKQLEKEVDTDGWIEITNYTPPDLPQKDGVVY